MSILTRRRVEAIEAVQDWLAGQPWTVTALTAHDLLAVGAPQGTVGWQIAGPTAEPFKLTVDREFPYSLPRIYPTSLASAPHVNGAGNLCIASDDARADTNNPAAVVAECVATAINLINENVEGLHEHDFIDDFRPYWIRSSTNKVAAWSLLDEKQRAPRLIKVYLGTNLEVLGEADGSLERWLENLRGREARKLVDGVYVWIDQLPKPADYPETVSDVRRLFAPGQKIIDDLLKRQVSPLLVVFRGPSGAGTAGGVVRLTPAIKTKRPRAARGARGFRSAASQPVELIACQWRASRVQETHVNAASTRLPQGLSSLRDKRVVVIGCGSLGAGVARFLLKSGVGRFLLIDPDDVRWENIGRHELGAQSITGNKANALATDMRRNFPQVVEVLSAGESWTDYLARVGEAAFDEYDLVISATGDWNAETALSDFQRASGAKWPVLYAWAEREAMAAHALVLNSHGPCLRCGFDSLGALVRPITGWARDNVADGCGAPMSPYGAIDIAQSQLLASKMAVDVLLQRLATPRYRVWLAPTTDLLAAGGHWHTRWKNSFGEPGDGGFQKFAEWPQKPGCGGCG